MPDQLPPRLKLYWLIGSVQSMLVYGTTSGQKPGWLAWRCRKRSCCGHCTGLAKPGAWKEPSA